MTDLKCGVRNCASNESDCCCRPDVKVTGAGAQYREETRCASFMERDSFMTNFVSYTHPDPPTEIYCDASHCAYNRDARCDARDVYVDGRDARGKSQTQCASFINTR
jgi:hypothetical protein